MKRKVGPARVLAVILSATFAFTNVITAAATSGDDAASLSTSEEEVVFETDDQSSSEEETVVADESAQEASSAAEADSEKASSEENEDAPLFEKVDPKEEGLEDPSTALNGEVTELPEEKKDPDEQTRVIIVMEGDAVLDKGFDTENLADNSEAMSLSENIIAEQEETIEKISEEALDGEELDVNYNLSILTNAVSADVAYKDIENIVNVDGVAAVYVAQKYDPQETAEPMTITSGDMVGSYTTWAAGYTGAGTRIAIIDTGIDADHPSFDAGAFDAHLNETAEAAGKSVADYSLLTAEEIAAVLPNLNVAQKNQGVTAEQLYLNEKIPFAFNYVDKDLDVTHDNDNQGDHGTHVSGISTANYYVPNSSSESGYARQDVGVVGIAPDAQLITMKVFGKGGGAYSDDYMAAIEDALLLKADVVNLSLGSSAAGYSSDSEEYVNGIFKKLEGTSTVVSISAGNSGRWTDDSTYGVNLSKDVNQDTVGSPGSYTNALTVASAVNNGMVGNYFATADGKKIFYTDGNDTLAPKFATLDTTGNGTDYPFVLIAGTGVPTDYEGLDVTDKIVFVQRGAITFGEKQMNAEAAGAKAVIIYNNQPGTISMTLQGSTAVIPAVSITLADAQIIAADSEQIADNAFAGTITVSSKIGVKTDTSDGYTMSDFSSYGVPSSLDLKPEITAPGGNIYSTRDGGTYGLMSGTSMAAPSISGQSALVEQYIRENGLADKTGLSVRTLAQTLLMSTAIPLHEDNDPSAPEFSPRSQGAGLANVYNAVSTPSYVLVGDKAGNDGKVKVVLGEDPEKSGNYSFAFDVYNMTDVPQYYVLDSTVMTEQLYEQSGITYFAGSSHVLNPSVSLSASDTALVYDINADGTVNKDDRKALLQVINDSAENQVIDQNQDYFDLNDDGVLNTKDVYLFGKVLNGKSDVANLGLEVVRVTDQTTVNVNINLSDADREYLAGFENGIYVDGFVYVKGNVDLSVPFLAFYGSWMDSSMFEDFDFEESVHNPAYSAQTYTGISKTNFLSVYPLGDYSSENEMYFIPNLVTDDAQYVPDRNAISSQNGTALGSMYYSLIRNASRVIMSITDRNTGEVYYEDTQLENYAAFIYQGQWENYIQYLDLMWKGTDKDGNALEDGVEVDVTLEAVPSYYDNVEDPTTLKGKGLYLTTPIAIDNTEPEIVGAAQNEDGKYNISVYDNRYVSSVLILNRNGDIVSRYAVNQLEKGVDSVVTIDAPEDVFYVEVFDYALNTSVYRFNNTGHADTKFVTEITLDKTEVSVRERSRTQVVATVGPKWLEEGYDGVEWTSSDESVATVNANGVITGVKEGTAVVTATTVATDKDGNHLSAEVKVTVTKRGGWNGTEDPDDESVEDASTDNSSVDETAVDEADEDSSEEIFYDINDEKKDNSADEASVEASAESSDSSADAASEETTEGGENDD
ncbi:serine protease subtilisin family [Butyrivibrio proteoclasticus B316]|uniref:Serine protease subtilisin family n=1 Tax=Butyrivibrio proteoclasticus (strain ATCC 51982 / DSM 14932 / B316) TaxID=515622 RepID=E0RYA4_BUTPB|nr:S8 family serine peptidase [Butyrivibrio proteoclasticus]ADL35362.1 serine protease subtilisin family [Butyrivibrio proteoclasticus B316]